MSRGANDGPPKGSRVMLLTVLAAVLVMMGVVVYSIGVLNVLLLTAIGIGSAVFVYQGDIVYYPRMPADSRTSIKTPNFLNLDYEDVVLTARDETKIHAFFMKHPGPGSPNLNASDVSLGSPQPRSNGVLYSSHCPTILYFHGNAGNIGHRLVEAKALMSFCGCNVFMQEYRGFGKSEGYPTEEGLCDDAQGSLEYLNSREDIDGSRIIVMGISLGAAVAIDLAYRMKSVSPSPIFGVIVENTFTSIPDMSLLVSPYFKYVPTLFYRNIYDSSSKIKNLNPDLPVLFLSGAADTLVPPSMMTKLSELCSSQRKILHRFPNGTHNLTWQCPGYYSVIFNFLLFCSSAPVQDGFFFDVNGSKNSTVCRIASSGSMKDIVVHDTPNTPPDVDVGLHMILSPQELRQLCGDGIGESLKLQEIRDV
eukprot:Nk52_evm17s232 gene=Nk52_evmTU17s232